MDELEAIGRLAAIAQEAPPAASNVAAKAMRAINIRRRAEQTYSLWPDLALAGGIAAVALVLVVCANYLYPAETVCCWNDPITQWASLL
jgi:hypothetical protein